MRAILVIAACASLTLLACGRDAHPAGAPEAPAQEPAPASEFSAPPPPPAAPAPAGDAPRSEEQERRADGLDEAEASDPIALAEADLARAQAELDSVLPPARRDQPATAAQSAPRAARPADSEGAGAAPKAKPEKKAAENGCATACRAFASLGRAAVSICRLTGDGDVRCKRAKGMVSEAEQRVVSCGCRSE